MSDRFTLGVEEEFQLVKLDSGDFALLAGTPDRHQIVSRGRLEALPT